MSIDHNRNIISVDEIIPGIWLGNEAASQSKEWIKAKNITRVINCSKHINSPHKHVKYLRIPINDLGLSLEMNDDNTILYESVDSIINFIDDALNRNEAILVHCHAGMQRSAAVLAIYLMKKRFRSNPNESIAFLRRRRPLVFNYGKSVNFTPAINKSKMAL